MSKTILSQVDGFTPLPDLLVNRYGILTAAIFGRMWRHCQDKDGVCRAKIETIAKELNVSRMTIMRHIETLVADGFFVDKTPKLKNKPHIYADTGKVAMYNRFGMGLTVTESDSAVTESDSQSHLELLEDSTNKKENKDTYNRKNGKKEAKERKEKQRAAKGDIVDLLVSVSPALQEQTLMRQRVENALHRNLDWDSTRSPWNGYDKKLVRREKDTGENIEGFMEWFNEDEFRKKGVIYLTPTKIEDWWLQAFTQQLSYEEQLAKAGYK